jgi:hypothetical protein
VVEVGGGVCPGAAAGHFSYELQQATFRFLLTLLTYLMVSMGAGQLLP